MAVGAKRSRYPAITRWVVAIARKGLYSNEETNNNFLELQTSLQRKQKISGSDSFFSVSFTVQHNARSFVVSTQSGGLLFVSCSLCDSVQC